MASLDSMSASGAIIATALSNLRQGYLQCMARGDPYNAITCVMNMVAQIPPDMRKEKEIPQPPSEIRDFTVDPDDTMYQSLVWKYFRELSYWCEELSAKYVYDTLASYRV